MKIETSSRTLVLGDFPFETTITPEPTVDGRPEAAQAFIFKGVDGKDVRVWINGAGLIDVAAVDPDSWQARSVFNNYKTTSKRERGTNDR